MAAIMAPGVAARAVTADDSAYRFLDQMLDAYPVNNGPRLPQSYSDQSGLPAVAFTYDAALALLAYLGDSRFTALQRARTIGDALLYAQDHDPQYQDGRLRQAYVVDGFVRSDGAVNIASNFGLTGSAGGDLAWAGIGLLALHRATGDARYLAGAGRIGQWVVQNCRSGNGFLFGVDAGGTHLQNSATEHNIDLTVLFGGLAARTGDNDWLAQREHALTMVRRMWNPGAGHFYTGTTDGTTINRSVIPEDIQTWSWLALRDSRYARAIGWATSQLTVTDRAGGVNSELTDGRSVTGLTFSSASLAADPARPIGANLPLPAPNGVWCEGTAHAVCALQQHGAREQAAALLGGLATVRSQLGAGQTVGGRPLSGGLVAATSPIDTGFGYGYYSHQHVGATAWFLFAAANRNPFC
ncbi:hypothetical protein [Kutzneria buriramensis]|uniref:Tat pathway signal sequence domain protein n=1 Tax=Kutzneria buriramensis TaxID=1045776 RepID=A0A3E0G7F6_9PSEU|nr:hypothetical protein [Kutzneria buriramensis]REH17987.1 hypothetical protein BCF44_13919 [Kutzneria buriramensis]